MVTTRRSLQSNGRQKRAQTASRKKYTKKKKIDLQEHIEILTSLMMNKPKDGSKQDNPAIAC